jgi:hypothetical protein
MVVRDMPLEAEAVEQRLLHHRRSPIIGRISRAQEKGISDPRAFQAEFFNAICRERTFLVRRARPANTRSRTPGTSPPAGLNIDTGKISPHLNKSFADFEMTGGIAIARAGGDQPQERLARDKDRACKTIRFLLKLLIVFAHHHEPVRRDEHLRRLVPQDDVAQLVREGVVLATKIMCVVEDDEVVVADAQSCGRPFVRSRHR